MESGKPDRIEFRILDYSVIGDDTVSFKLEDGTVVKVKVSLDRAGVATNYKNPDGTAHYAVNTSVKVFVVPYDRRFTMSRNKVLGAVKETSEKHETPSHIG